MASELSIIIPVFNNPNGPAVLLKKLIPVLDRLDTSWRILFINDGSTDGGLTGDALHKAVKTDERIACIHLNNNQGQQESIFLGFQQTLQTVPAPTNHFFITMDDDLSHPPEIIPLLLAEIQRGRDMVYAISTRRYTLGGIFCIGGILRDLFFQKCLNTPSGVRVGSFRILSAELIKKIVAENPPFIYISAIAFRHTQNVRHIRYSTVVQKKKQIPTRVSFIRRVSIFAKLVLYYGNMTGKIMSSIHPEQKNRDTIISKRIGWIATRHCKLHILGGGFGQLSAIKKAGQLGISTVVSDIQPKAPGLAYADEISLASTFDAHGVTHDARKFGSTAFLATGTDQPVYTAAQAAYTLGIPFFLDISTARMVTNKKYMKRVFKKAGVPTPNFRIIHKQATIDALVGLIPPLVVKPLDSQGQRGIYRFDTYKEIIDILPHVLSFSREQEVLVEEYYPSDEVTVSGWVENEEYFHLLVTDRISKENPPHIGVCLAHHYPSVYQIWVEEICSLTRDIIKEFQIRKGPIYFQYLIGDEGIKVNEIACRLGGAYEDEFIPWITGVDILDVMIKLSCGMDYTPLRQKSIIEKSQGKYISLQMFFYQQGIIGEQTGMDKVLSIPGILGGGFLLSDGTEIRNRENSTQRAGYIIVSGESTVQVNDRTKIAFAMLEILDINGKNMLSHPPMLLPE